MYTIARRSSKTSPDSWFQRKLLLTTRVSQAISNEEIEQRSVHGYTQFLPPGVNEALLEAAGFRLVGQEDRTESFLVNANGRYEPAGAPC